MSTPAYHCLSPLLFIDVEPHLRQSRSQDRSDARVLQDFLRANPEVRLIATSTSRLYVSLEVIRRHLLTDALARRLIGVTPDLADQSTSTPLRKAEIDAWRATHGHAGPYAVIDDNPDLFPPGYRPLVLMESAAGITSAEITKAAAFLGLTPRPSAYWGAESHAPQIGL